MASETGAVRIGDFLALIRAKRACTRLSLVCGAVLIRACLLRSPRRFRARYRSSTLVQRIRHGIRMHAAVQPMRAVTPPYPPFKVTRRRDRPRGSGAACATDYSHGQR